MSRVPDLGRLALAVQDCPAVVALHPGGRGAITAVLDGGRLAGLFLSGTVLVVGVVAVAGTPSAAVVDQVRAAVRVHAPHLFVAVTVVGHHGGAGRARAS